MRKLNPFRPGSARLKRNAAASAAKTAAAVAALCAFQTACAACTATMGNINFGNIDPLNPGNLTAQAQLTVTCSRDSTGWTAFRYSEYMNVCLAVDGGRASGWNNRTTNPRGLCLNGSCAGSTPLYYNLYTDSNYSTIWGTPNLSATPNVFQTTFTFPARNTASQSNTFTVYAKLNEPFTGLVPGAYSIAYTEGATALASASSTGSMPASCGSMKTIRFPFTVSANIIKNCIVGTPDDIDFGTAAPTDTNLQGQASFNVTCTNSTPYNIGLKPSNNSTTGAGVMSPTSSGNADRVPYQLRSASGANGKIWGNTATASANGNGVGGMGTGSAQSYTVYATVPSADYHYGEYRDTVTVMVNY